MATSWEVVWNSGKTEVKTTEEMEEIFEDFFDLCKSARIDRYGYSITEFLKFRESDYRDNQS